MACVWRERVNVGHIFLKFSCTKIFRKYITLNRTDSGAFPYCYHNAKVCKIF